MVWLLLLTQTLMIDSLIFQRKRRVLVTDEWLKVKGCENVYALGDCATIDQRKVMVCTDLAY